MSMEWTTMSGPVELGLPLRPPRPVEGCDVCAALAKQRAAARERGDLSAVSDCNVEIGAHGKGH
jgi:hypothetical protein